MKEGWVTAIEGDWLVEILLVKLTDMGVDVLAVSDGAIVWEGSDEQRKEVDTWEGVRYTELLTTYRPT